MPGLFAAITHNKQSGASLPRPSEKDQGADSDAPPLVITKNGRPSVVPSGRLRLDADPFGAADLTRDGRTGLQRAVVVEGCQLAGRCGRALRAARETLTAHRDRLDRLGGARAVGSTDATLQGRTAGGVQIVIDGEAVVRGGGRGEAGHREGAAVRDLQLADLAAHANPVRRIGSHHVTGVATNVVRVVVSCVDDVAAGTSVDRIEPDALDGVYTVAPPDPVGPRGRRTGRRHRHRPMSS